MNTCVQCPDPVEWMRAQEDCDRILDDLLHKAYVERLYV